MPSAGKELRHSLYISTMLDGEFLLRIIKGHFCYKLLPKFWISSCINANKVNLTSWNLTSEGKLRGILQYLTIELSCVQSKGLDEHLICFPTVPIILYVKVEIEYTCSLYQVLERLSGMWPHYRRDHGNGAVHLCLVFMLFFQNERK